MSLKKYGIYTAYPPTVNMKKEGLGRYLVSFINGASARNDVCFVIVCPSWSHEDLESLLASEHVPEKCYEVISPSRKPFILRIYEAYNCYKMKPPKKARISIIERLKKVTHIIQTRLENRIAIAYSLLDVLILLIQIMFGFCGLLLLSPFIVIAGLFFLTGSLLKAITNKICFTITHFIVRFNRLVTKPKDDGLVLRFFSMMNDAESKRIQQIVDRMDDVKAWYSPTSFWPDFNKINKPRLMCVPDVVLSDFPVGFSLIGGSRLLTNYEAVEDSIRNGLNYITYSQNVKWNTLVDRYNIPAEKISVIHHAPNDLSRWVTVTGFDNEEETSRRYCESLLATALRKSSNSLYTNGFSNTAVQFLFYASQFRPNKNVISLLRAYEYLLKKKFIRHKLVLTGDLTTYPLISDFVREHHLENDVLCLHDLSIQELAACYKLADLAINPSLSEGGMPFTFTEALSVGTPVIMAKTLVSEEVLQDRLLQSMTFFDPYDWEAMARKIIWGLEHRDDLLMCQQNAYYKLSQRTWTDVVNEHIEILDRISTTDSE